ncbi:alpha/beta fold hydrolase [Actinomadura harenae]|uniref:Alpha/beta fold hydrolase n=1 Tax=Actinomadura harenae TaxID=2483351 RepID=A0A3M2LXD7_9ACTN|nr:alpha/beta fold hydrolase [Actinomadura harenae]
MTLAVAVLATTAATAASPPESALAAPSTAPSTAPSWGPCPEAEPGADAQCADIKVPLSWSAPRGRTITLHVSRLPALDRKHRIGAMLFNPGGPGGEGGALIAAAGREVMAPSLQNRFDIIGFDPRGVGRSTAVKCGGPALSAKVPVFPDSPAQLAAVRRQSAAYGAACVKNSEPGLVANVDTVSAARDMDAIRVALGEKKISYLGLSYGTYLGQTFARLYPHRVNTMVLDGAMDHAVSPSDFLYEEASAVSVVFGRFASWCSATASCALHGQNVTKVWDDLLARAARKPIPAPNAQHGATTVNDDTIRMVLPNLLLISSSSLVPATWPTLGDAIARARAGDASLLANSSSVDQTQDAYAAIGCQSFPPQLRGYADAAARLRKARALSPHTGGASEAWLITDLCASWPLPASDPWAPQKITGTPPILVTSTRYDPSTPLVWAQGLHREIAGSGLLVAEVAGHTAFLNSACARTEQANYLITGKLPTTATCGA